MFTVCPQLPEIEHGQFACGPFDNDDISARQTRCSVECDEYDGYHRSLDGLTDVTCGPDTGPEPEEFAWFNAENSIEEVDVNDTALFATCERKKFRSLYSTNC